MAKIIIGIHGLGNKPPERILKHWWKEAIKEGLLFIGRPRFFLRFEMVYWAHFLHPNPLNPGETNKENPLYLEEPYAPAEKLPSKKPERFRQKVLGYLEKQFNRVFLNKDMSIKFPSVSDFIVQHYFKDLDDYYSGRILDDKSQRPLKNIIRKQLTKVLRKHRKKDILLIAHSMGSIIAYDVLTQVAADLEIDTLVTVGSPLGLPVVMSRIATEQSESFLKSGKLTTPENVLRNWYNFSDLHDRIALNYNLGDDFSENSRHVQAIDFVVHNDYEYKGRKNHHKSYGYLRTPELAQVIHDFLNSGKNTTMISLSDRINKLVAAKTLKRKQP